MYIAPLWQRPVVARRRAGEQERGRKHAREQWGGGVCEHGQTRLSGQSVGSVSPVRSRLGQKEEENDGLCLFLPVWPEGGGGVLQGVTSSTMGCSLCTLQKPEEQYKLLYEVCQVRWPSSFQPRGTFPGSGSLQRLLCPGVFSDLGESQLSRLNSGHRGQREVARFA